MIARESHMTPSLLQKYYPTKELILEAFVERAVGEFDLFTTTVQKTVGSTPDTRQLFTKLSLSYCGFVRRMRGFYLTWVTSPEIVAPYASALPQFISLNQEILAKILSDRIGISHDRALHRVRVIIAALFTWVIYYDRVGITNREGTTERVSRLVDALLSTSLDDCYSGNAGEAGGGIIPTA